MTDGTPVSVPPDWIAELGANRRVFEPLLHDVDPARRRWRPHPESWCLLEVVCHLFDEEREDFRSRLRLALEAPGYSVAPIDPEGWPRERGYGDREYHRVVRAFLNERDASLEWLEALDAPDWSRSVEHPELGALSARAILASWVAHDYLHMRQIVRLRYGHLGRASGVDLSYAGQW